MRMRPGAQPPSAVLFSSPGLLSVNPRATTGPLISADCVPPAAARQEDEMEEDKENDPDLWHGNKRRTL